MKKTARFISTIAPLLYMVLVWVLSGLPDNVIIDIPQNNVDRFLKESLHLVEFAILYVLLINAFLVNGKLKEATHIASAVIACFYGLTDEIHQAFVPYRSATVIDAIKDITGVLICFSIVQYAYFKKPASRIGQTMQKYKFWALSKNENSLTK
ncbi:MAG TPA: VanZ family protein [Chondromyces sp.]|nr:VanZ family protein [Chondromyces sp.]